MSTKKLPWFDIFAKPCFYDNSSVHELPYDHSILLENLIDPAHLPISHDRTDFSAKREDAKPLVFDVTERTNRGFAGTWGQEKDGKGSNVLRFDATCVLQNIRELWERTGSYLYGSGMRIPARYLKRTWGFLSSQNEVLMKKKVPTKELYINLKSSDTWVAEYRKWIDKVGHGMPYHFGHRTISPLPKLPPVVEHAPAGLIAGLSASYPAKGGIGTMHAPNLANRYFRHVIHCRSCIKVIKSFQLWKNVLSGTAVAFTALAILVVSRQWKAVLLAPAALCSAAAYASLRAIQLNTNNFIRKHRRL
ncbi:unnamed protein product [Eruca vesicaria subsp. sativa]|uniref:Uncharacterized protein n=1 Tax=Eruca vesicaria subsp. sativa TaxID=29727 RepID=A0ABC8JZ45_ERUVS|nr:unnamed protein product [Eruca vesicaria subsp. sativa]